MDEDPLITKPGSTQPVTVYVLSENDKLIEVESSETDQLTAEVLSKHSVPIKTRLKSLVKGTPSGEGDSDESSNDENDPLQDSFDNIDEDARVRELTMKYINGELNFSEYSALVDFDNQVDGEVNLCDLPKEDDLPAAPKKSKERIKRKRKLPPALKGLMGEANLTFARGDADKAITICMEVIKETPFFPEPYQTLGMIYEELGQSDKSMQFQLIAAHLSPPDAEEWTRLGEMLVEVGDLQQAITCYSKAIRANPFNIGLHMELCRLLEQAGQKKYALKMYARIFKYLDADQGSEALNLAKYIAKMHHENSDFAKAIEAMDLAFTHFPGYVTSEEINLMLELMLSNKEHAGCIMVLCEYCGVSFQPSLPPSTTAKSSATPVVRYSDHIEEEIESWVQTCSSVSLPETMSIDLHVKLVISLIYLNATNLLDKLLTGLKSSDPDETGDLYLDVAEAYMANGRHEDAIPFLETLVTSTSYNLPAVWLQLAECLKATHQYEGAIDAYKCVMRMAPHHSEAKVSLSEIFQEMGFVENALDTLSQSDPSQPLDAVLLHRQCNLLLNDNRIEEFIQTAILALSRHCPSNWNGTECVERPPKKKFGCANYSQYSEQQYVNSVPQNEEYDLFDKLCHILFERGMFAELQKITSSSLHSKILCDEYRRRNNIPYHSVLAKRFWDLDVWAIYAAYFNKDYGAAFNLMRDMLARDTTNVGLLNLFSLIIQKCDDLRYQRFLVRLQGSHLNEMGIIVLNANTSLTNGSYKYAMADYMTAHKLDPSNNFLCLMLGVLYAHISCQRKIERRHTLVVQSFAFLEKYIHARGECQETMYNVGRACHQLGLHYLALNYYKKALLFHPPAKELDLRREIAYNIVNIYRSSGALNLALHYTKKYIVV